jgi:cell wall-associated NlpC family hydrolase
LWVGPPARPNPRSSAQAIAWARTQVDHPTMSWYHRCLNFVAEAYRWREAGVRHAIDHFRFQPHAMRFVGDRNAPPGALLFWWTGHRSGHVALSLGDGLIATNDILRPGRIDIVEAVAPERVWGARYLGWAVPYFPHGKSPSR